MSDRRLAGGVALVDGALLIVGARLPWLTLFAGLQRLPGTQGSYGWALVVAGLAVALVGAGMAVGRLPDLRRPLGALGLVALGFCLWLLDGQRAVLSELRRTPIYVPRGGPGIAVATVGAAMLALLGPWGWWAKRRAGRT